LNILRTLKQLTISGEVSIGTNSHFTGNITEIQNFLNTIVDTLRKDNPQLKIQSKRELYEFSIKIFAYRKLMMDHSFLENLRRRFQSLLDYGADFDGLTIRLNIYGELNSLIQSEKFRYVNKQSEVVFMNNQFPAIPWIPQKLSSKQIGFLIFIVLLVITVALLVYFKVIPLFSRPLVA
jgi:hypothetical protein